MSDPLISVVSLTWNSARFVRPLLTSLLADSHGSGVPIEVIVIDNGSTDDTLALLDEFAAEHEEVRVVRLPWNHGTTASRNIGIRLARGEYVLILDSDTEMPPGTLAGLVEGARSLPEPERLGILHPRLVYPSGELQESARRFPTVLTKVYRLFRLEGLRAADESIAEVLAQQTTTVDYAISACWLVPRKVFDDVGLLDENIFYSPEDVEFCARLWQRGYRVWYYPRVEVVHNCQRLTSKRPLSKLGLSHIKGLVYYWRRYDYAFERPAVEHLRADH